MIQNWQHCCFCSGFRTFPTVSTQVAVIDRNPICNIAMVILHKNKFLLWVFLLIELIDFTAFLVYTHPYQATDESSDVKI